ncbi:MAG: hypothetical protein B0W54_13080 [Cellvibrio sp. 79]|nr:MAG: hypothetical protein B0W54_13080 [Cellvibrio sp. 79]
MFVYIAGNIALDFCNTETKSRGETIELLNSVTDLKLWAEGAGLGLTNHKVLKKDLDNALDLRQAIKGLLAARLAHEDPRQSDIDTLNQYLVFPVAEQELKYTGGSFFIKKNVQQTIELLFAQIAQSATEVLLDGQKYTLKQCANPACILYFLDKSKTQQRKWCSMVICGNRLKVSNHHKRHKTLSDDEAAR